MENCPLQPETFEKYFYSAYDWFNDTICISDYIASYERIINKKLWEELIRLLPLHKLAFFILSKWT
jgi:hypothetical protein